MGDTEADTEMLYEEQEPVFAYQDGAESPAVVQNLPSTSASLNRDVPAAGSVAKKGGATKDSERLGKDATKLLSHLTQYFDEKMENLKREIVDDDIRVSKRFKPSYDFKRKSNKKNYEHNSEIQMRMEEARRSLDNPNPNIERATTALQQGMSANSTRNKHILIADQSDAGWATVDEYLVREIASDSEDDRRITKAEFKAQKKFRGRRRGNGGGGYRGYNHNNNYSQPRSGYYGSNNQNFVSDPAFQQYGYQPRPPTNTAQPFNNNRCHICNELGHWKKFCPRRFNLPHTITTSKQA